MQPMKFPFRSLGVMSVVFSGICFLAASANRHTANLGGHNLAGFYWFGLFGLLIGCGLLARNFVAAWLFSGTTAIIGLWLVVGSIMKVPFPGLLINLGLGFLLLRPIWIL